MKLTTYVKGRGMTYTESKRTLTPALSHRMHRMVEGEPPAISSVTGASIIKEPRTALGAAAIGWWLFAAVLVGAVENPSKDGLKESSSSPALHVGAAAE